MRRNGRLQCLFGIMLLTLAPAVVLRAQTPSPTPSLEHEFFKNILRDQKAIWTAPFHLERRDMKWVIPAGVGFMALVTTDRITGDDIFTSNRQVRVSQDVSYAGSVYGLGAVATTFYLIGRKKDNYRARETGLLSAEALIDGMLASGAVKIVTQRARPIAGNERSEFFDGGSSFPSGHSTQAWAVAAVIASEYKDRPAVQIAAYGIASAVSVARFTVKKHYLSDVVAGSALGFGIGRFVYNAHHRESGGLTITPQFNRQARQYGVALTWNF